MTAKRIIMLSEAELNAVLEAISQMTGGNGDSFSEWHSQTHGSYGEWRALQRGERKLRTAAAITEAQHRSLLAAAAFARAGEEVEGVNPDTLGRAANIIANL